jgi:tetratricopeptide (TPR) repeat protein
VATAQLGALVALMNQGRLQEAENRAIALLADHAATGVLWKILSVALVRQGKNALHALRHSADLLPDDAEAHSNLGSALLAAGKHAEALTSLRRALALRPDDPATLADAADALRALGRLRDSVPLYERALQLEPRAPEVSNNLGNALLGLGQPADAAVQYRAALEARPDAADIHCNLGNALRQQGQFQEAIAASERAIALEPGLAMAHNNLGLSLTGLGLREQAVTRYRQALALNPAYVEALDNLGTVLCDLGGHREALALHTRALELDPQRPEAHYSLGTSLYELRRLDDAVDSYRRALALRPAYSAARVALATTLRALGQVPEAEASCRAVLAVHPDEAEALSLLGELHADRGRFQEAREVLERVIALDPGRTSAYCSLAAHRRMTPEDTAWLHGAQALLAQSLPLNERIGLCYALGKYFDDVGRYDEAFHHYRQANELTKSHGPGYDRDKLVRLRERITTHFNVERLSRLETGESASELPVFIIGMPRSGTSLAEQILASHPQVHGAGEIRFWSHAFGRLEREGLESEVAARLVPELAREYLEHVSALGGGALRVIDKMPANFLHAGLIHAALPRARIIHMRRHPLDTCLSIYCQNFFNMGPHANDLADLAHYYREYLTFMGHWRAALPATTLLEVPYEALIEDQEGWSRRMVDFIGLPWDPRCLGFHQTQRVVMTASKWQVRQKLHSGSVARWRRYEPHLGPLLALLERA